MRFDILTIFPQFFQSVFSFGILKRAQERGLISISTRDIRSFADDKHKTVDDSPYGGGGGMIMKAEPLCRAVESVKIEGKNTAVILTSPRGERFSDKMARELSRYEQIVLVCGRYEGIDERVRELSVDKEVSIGDFILSGGEYAASVIVDSVSRFIPGVLGNEESAEHDSFEDGLLEHPQFTRPEEYRGKRVPQVLLSGNHGDIKRWKRRERIKRTFLMRPDLLDKARLKKDDLEFLGELKKEGSPSFRVYIALVHYPVYNKAFSVVTTAFVNLDVHDMARAARTYGIRCFFLVQPSREQQMLVERVLRHWIEGPGAAFNFTRVDALKLVRIKNSLEETIEEIEQTEGERPKIVVTDARHQENMIGYSELRQRIMSGNEPYLILLGTGWGMAREVMERADYALKPVEGFSDYNHLSVRSAGSIILDRLLSAKM